MKKHRLKEKLLKELREAPNVSRACQRLDISRQTYYRWLREDSGFKADLEDALVEGYESMRDFAESKLMVSVGNLNQRAIEYTINRSEKKLQRLRSHSDPYQGKTLAELIMMASERKTDKT